MRPKSGLPKRKALRNMPEIKCGLRETDNGRRRKPRKPTSVASLFCGCGGMDLGFEGGFEFKGEQYRSLPFKIERAIDFDERAIETYRLNLGNAAADVADLTQVESSDLPACDVLLGGFPCQDFSSCGPKTGFAGKRGMLYKVIEDYLHAHQPMIVVAENVPYLARLQNGNLLRKICEDFESAGYRFAVWTLYLPDYGLPQNRTRLFIVGVRNDIHKAFGSPLAPEPAHFTEHRTIDWAIDDLMNISDETVCNQSQYFVATKATKGAGQGDQKNESGTVSYAIRANPKARVHFHHRLNRRLTVRECARLQSFPDEFVFPFTTSANMLQIGNAVPPIVAHQVACEIGDFIRKIDRARGKERQGAKVLV